MVRLERRDRGNAARGPPDEIAAALNRGLAMSREERRARWEPMMATLRLPQNAQRIANEAGITGGARLWESSFAGTTFTRPFSAATGRAGTKIRAGRSKDAPPKEAR